MLSDQQRRRFARQIQLLEVGEAGQLAIVSGRAAVAGTGAPARWLLRHRLAAEYARRAGFGELVAAAAISLDLLAPPSLVTQPAAREVLAASRLAVLALRAAVTPQPPR